MITVMGATGHTGKKSLKLYSREARKFAASELAELENAGAEVRSGEQTMRFDFLAKNCFAATLA